MKAARKELRDGELEGNTYGRLTCSECGESLEKKNDPDEMFSVRVCAGCEREWKELR